MEVAVDSRVFRIRLGDGSTWVVTSSRESFSEALAEAEAKRERAFPHDSVAVVEAWSDGSFPWKPLPREAACIRCPARDVMPDLGTACETSCGVTD